MEGVPLKNDDDGFIKKKKEAFGLWKGVLGHFRFSVTSQVTENRFMMQILKYFI